ncbi:MAG: DUF3592 domain-containing protein [Pseudomonadota bacterium]
MRAGLKTKSDFSIILIFFGALAVVGVFAGGAIVQDYARARASASWPTVDGIVLSQLESASNRVRYVYSMNGRSHESTRERVFLARFSTMANVDYLPGENVMVFVNPQDHSYSVLYPGGAGVAFVIFSILSGACIFFGIGGIVWTLSQSAGQQFFTAAEAI